MGETRLAQHADRTREIDEARRRAALGRGPALATTPAADLAVDTLQQRANLGPGVQHTAQLRALLDARPVAPLQRRGSGEPLPEDLQAGLTRLSGQDVSSVNVFYDSPEPARYQAHAVTQGRDIHVAPGREGDVPHEAWHAVQQMQRRVQPTFDLGGVPVNDSPSLEHEADVMGARAKAAGRAALSQAPAQRRAVAGAPVARRAPAQFFLTSFWRGAARGASLLAGAAYGAFQGAAYGSTVGPLGTVGGALVGGLLGGVGLGGLAYGASGAAIDIVELREFRQRLRAIRDAQQGTATPQAFADQQTRNLDSLEHDIYTWLDENRLNPATRAFAPQVLNVLDGVQAEHLAVINTVHQQNLNLWTPDRDTLGGVEQGRLQAAWTALRNGTGLIQGGAGAGQGPDELRAMHARLLSRPGGRRLLYTLLDMQPGDQRNRNVGINFTPADTRSAQQKARVRELQAEQKRVAARLRGMATTHPDYDNLIGRQMALVGQIDDEGGASNAAAARATDMVNATLAGPRGGSGAAVNVRLGTRDSQDLAYDRLGRPNVSPAWLQYGHELIHAFHYRNAEERGAENFAAYRGSVWGNMEEHHTIASLNLFPGAISENDLRAEHGITARYGHSGTTRDEFFGR